MSGKFTGAGVGPGDPELITCKALRVIRESSVIAIPVSDPELQEPVRDSCPEKGRYSRYLEKLAQGGKDSEEEQHIYRIGGLELNEEKVELRVDGVPVKVTPMEYRILLLLMKHPGRVFSADEIYERVWNEKAVNSDTIMVHVRNIREKIEINPKNPKYLKVVWGVGYKMEKQ